MTLIRFIFHLIVLDNLHTKYLTVQLVKLTLVRFILYDSNHTYSTNLIYLNWFHTQLFLDNTNEICDIMFLHNIYSHKMYSFIDRS